MKIRYSYRVYNNCPEATERSKFWNSVLSVLDFIPAIIVLGGTIGCIIKAKHFYEFFIIIPILIFGWLFVYYFPKLIDLSCGKLALSAQYPEPILKMIKKELNKKFNKEALSSLLKTLLIVTLVTTLTACIFSAIRNYSGLRVVFIIGAIASGIALIISIIILRRPSYSDYHELY